MKLGLTLGCYTPLCFVDESIYDIDRLQIVIHGVSKTDGKDNWDWRRSSINLIQRARREIDEKNPACELAVDGGLRWNNMEPVIACNPDVMILSSAIFKDPDGIGGRRAEMPQGDRFHCGKIRPVKPARLLPFATKEVHIGNLGTKYCVHMSSAISHPTAVAASLIGKYAYCPAGESRSGMPSSGMMIQSHC